MNTWIIVTIIILAGGCLTGLVEWYHCKKIYDTYVRESLRSKQLVIKEVHCPTVTLCAQTKVYYSDVCEKRAEVEEWILQNIKEDLANEVLKVAEITVQKDFRDMKYIVTARVKAANIGTGSLKIPFEEAD